MNVPSDEQLISHDELARIERRSHAAVHGKKVVLDALKAAGVGWNHTSGHTHSHLTDHWRRGRWTLVVEWSQGGRIAGATLHEDQVDPDTGHVKIRPNGEVVRYLRWAIGSGQRQKKERIVALLSAAPEHLRTVVERVFAEQSAEMEAKDAAKRRAVDGF